MDTAKQRFDALVSSIVAQGKLRLPYGDDPVAEKIEDLGHFTKERINRLVRRSELWVVIGYLSYHFDIAIQTTNTYELLMHFTVARRPTHLPSFLIGAYLREIKRWLDPNRPVTACQITDTFIRLELISDAEFNERLTHEFDQWYRNDRLEPLD